MDPFNSQLTLWRFPLSGHLVNTEPEILPPLYLEQQPFKDLSLLYPSNSEDYLNVDLIHNWPLDNPSTLDASQFEALRRILTKQLAIVQGPPGTGKTHVSVVALELLIRNMSPHDPPVILAAHTNHAVDQLLRHVARFEPDFIRLGGMTTDMENIRPRTLFEVRNNVRQGQDKLRPPSLAKQKNVGQDIKALLAPFSDCEEPFSAQLFKQYGVITETQYDSLEKGAAEWVRVEECEQVQGTIAMWLGRELAKADARTVPEDFGFEFEEIDLEFEQLKELEAEAKIDDESIDTIRGELITVKELFTGRKSTRGVTEELVKAALEKQDMWEIDEPLRGAVYRSLQQRLKDAMRRALRGLAKAYEETVQDVKSGRWVNDAKILRKTRIIGMTTTGLSKYRGLIQSLNPKIVLIEEAAETLEAYVTAACFPSLQHLILVGDHQQLRGHCTVKELEGDPWFLDVSMFERLVRNRIGFSQMITQRRMIPEIRRALKPIYEDLTDHESVLNRASIPGMGGINTFFFSHEWPESSDHQMSKVNPEEATMITNFYYYLVQNGTAVANITILTFYNGQRKLITKTLRSHPGLQGFRFNIATVDSFQGEENDIVILSLARNNSERKIGFLEVENRVCVALSRAQRGFYIFGNALMLSQASPLWWEVVQAMGRDPTRVGFTLTVTCQNHGEEVYITEPNEFATLSGGCERICGFKLSCGHLCTLNCHPFSHDLVDCKAICKRALECGHECQQTCGQDCTCSCNDIRGRDVIAGSISTPPLQSESSPKRALPITEEGRPFREYAEGGHKESDANLDAIGTNNLVNPNESVQNVVGDLIPVVNGSQDMKLVRTTSDVDGTKRGVWKGTWVGNQNSKGKDVDQDPEINVDWKEKRHHCQVEDSEKGGGEESEEYTLVEDKAEDSSNQDGWMVQASLLD